jgi:hypothetical protein
MFHRLFIFVKTQGIKMYSISQPIRDFIEAFGVLPKPPQSQPRSLSHPQEVI